MGVETIGDANNIANFTVALTRAFEILQNVSVSYLFVCIKKRHTKYGRNKKKTYLPKFFFCFKKRMSVVLITKFCLRTEEAN